MTQQIMTIIYLEGIGIISETSNYDQYIFSYSIIIN